MNRILLLTALVLAVLLSAACSQQETSKAEPGTLDPADPESPEFVALASVKAMQALDYDSLVELMHPETLEDLKAVFDNMLTLLRATYTDSTAYDPMMPEGFRQIIAQDSEPTPKEFVRALLTGLMNLTPEMRAMMEPMLQSIEVTAVGSVYEGDTLAHVLVRKNMDLMGVQMHGLMEVVSLKRDNGRWRITLPADLQRMTQTMLPGLMSP